MLKKILLMFKHVYSHHTVEVEVGFALDELLNLQERGQFPDESVKTEDTQIHHVDY
jgi:hypothetical protein